MRLYHYKLIPYLPNSDLKEQWRQLQQIFKQKQKDILINYIYGYPRRYIQEYSKAVMNEMESRGYKVTDTAFQHYLDYCMKEGFLKSSYSGEDVHFREHSDLYLTICYYNLCEKYLRGQADFTDEIFEKLQEFYASEVKEDDGDCE